MARKTTEQFIIESKRIFGEDTFIYNKTVYESNKKHLIITCPTHGDFKVRPDNHLFRHSICPHCAKKFRPTTEDWIKKAKVIHGDKYDYSKTVYVNNHTKVCIICPKHGEFWQLPNDHLNCMGCKKCSRESLSKKFILSTSEFIKKAKEVHGDKYDYSKSFYEGSHSYIKISCKIHGEFITMPYIHLQGCGCPKCNQSHLETEIENFLKENNIKFEQQKHFIWLGLQSIDFYLIDYNIAIECQGEQHYESIDFFGGSEGYKQTLERDQRKKQLCEENGVELLYFTHYNNINEEGNIYKDKDKLLEKIKTKKCL